MLDRGQLLDWFSSREIMTEAIVAGARLLSVPGSQLSTTQSPSSTRHLFQDRNFVAANIFIFVVGVVLFATLALLPPMLQNQMQYPVVLTGPGDGAARARHDDRHVPGRPAGDALRSPPDHRGWAWP